MTLTINKIAIADEGDYYCHAENSFGAAIQPVSVRVRNTVKICIQLRVAENYKEILNGGFFFFLYLIDFVAGNAQCNTVLHPAERFRRLYERVQFLFGH